MAKEPGSGSGFESLKHECLGGHESTGNTRQWLANEQSRRNRQGVVVS